MPSTERRQRRIDAKLPETSAAVGTPVTTSAGTAVSPEIPTPVAPSGLTATGTYVVNSAVTPQAVVNLRWVAVTSPTPDAYAIQWSLDSGFTNPTTVITAREQVTAAVSGLPTNRTVWFRIAARWQWVQSAWSASISTTTANDTTPSALPTGETATFGTLTGDLTVDWVNPTSANYRDIKIDIYNQSGGTLLRTEYVRDSPYVYSLDMNKSDTSSTGDPSLYLELRSRTFANVLSSTADTLSPTFAVPAQVTGVTASANSVTGSLTFVYPSVATAIRYRLTLDGVARETTATTYEYTRALNEREHGGSFDTSIVYSIVAVDVFGQVSATATTGTATFGVPAQPSGVTADFSQPDCRFIWSAATDATGYRLSLDSVDRDLGYTNTHTYTLARNAAEHGGTADHTLSWSLVAYNVAGSSTAATGTVTSPLPVAPTAVSLSAFFSTLAVSVTHPGVLPTHRTYQYRITRNSGAFIQTKQNSQVFTTSISAGGTYQAHVLTEDVFGRQSAETASAAVVADTLTIAELRAEGTYTDNQTVNNTLTDGTNTLIDNNTLVLVDGDDLNELKDNSTTSSGVTYSAGTAWQNATRFERPLTERYRTITAGLFAPTTNTQMYVSTSVDGSTWRWFAGPLTSVTSASATLSEVISETAARAAPVAIGSNATVTRWDLPRIVEARYVRLHHRNTTPASYVLYEFYPRRLVQSDDIEAESIRAINISAEAITADKISANAIDGKTITGATIRTGASGARVVLDSTGLTTFNSSDQAVIEVTTANNGELRAGIGSVRLNRTGAIIVGSNTPTISNAGLQFINASGTLLGSLQSGSGSDVSMYIFAQNNLNLSTTADIILTSTYVGVGVLVPSHKLHVAGNVNVSTGNGYRVAGTQVIGAQITGWGAITGTVVRTGFDTGTVTLAGLAQRVGQLIIDLEAHGLIA